MSNKGDLTQSLTKAVGPYSAHKVFFITHTQTHTHTHTHTHTQYTHTHTQCLQRKNTV